MKTLLLALHHTETLSRALNTVVKIARAHGSHVIGYYPIPGEEFLAMPTPEIVVPFGTAVRASAERDLPTVRRTFEARMEREGIPFEFRVEQLASLHVADAIARNGRAADMIVLPMTAYKGRITAEYAGEVAYVVQSAGRPVFAIPPDLARPYRPRRMTLAWNASREAARAAFDGIPLLREAEGVDVLWVNPSRTEDRDVHTPGAEIANVLARHGADVDVRTPSTRKRASRVIVEHAKSSDADLLVIGAYGHSRLRERILGGVTEYVLRHPPCCILLST